MTLEGVNSEDPFRQPGGRGRNGAGARWGLEGFSAQTSAASSAIVTTTSAIGLRPGFELVPLAPDSLELDSVEDIRVDAF